MCSGLRRAMAHAGVPSLEQTDPAVWLASTVLVRELRRLAEGRPGNPA